MDQQLCKVLLDRSGELFASVELFLGSAKRPCFRLQSERVSDKPLRRSGIAKWFGGQPAAPQLGVTESKFGGVPYEEGDGLGASHAFLGQLNLADFDAPRIGLPESGVVVLWAADELDGEPYEARWYPAASSDRYEFSGPSQSLGKWETRLAFKLAKSLPGGDDWIAPIEPYLPDDELRDEWVEYGLMLLQEHDAPGHQLGGHRSGGLFDTYDFSPPEGFSDDVKDWEMLLRLDFDNPAGFGWGSNVVYFVVPSEDWERGDLSRTYVTAANY